MKLKQIAFNIDEAREVSPTALWAKADKKEEISVEELLSAGAPYTRFWLNRKIGEEIKPGDILASFSPRLIPDIDLGMIAVPGEKFRVMRTVLTVGHFRWFVEATGYKVGAKSKAVLKQSAADAALPGLSLADGRAFSEWFNEQTGRKTRVPTEKEWEVAQNMIGIVLGSNYWEWTETPSGTIFVLRNPSDADRCSYCSPESRYDFNAVRLVEDLS